MVVFDAFFDGSVESEGVVDVVRNGGVWYGESDFVKIRRGGALSNDECIVIVRDGRGGVSECGGATGVAKLTD